MSVTVGYPGPAGSHSGAAAVVLVPDAAEVIGLPSFTAVVDAASSAEITLGVLPIESSLMGPIAETHDLLYEAPLSIVREASLPIRHCVLGVPGSTLDGATTLRSHPAAFDQCRELLSGLHLRCIPAATTADAAREVAEAGDSTQFAIASAEAALEYGLQVVADDVGDPPGAFTRFVALAPYTQIAGGERWRTALSFVTDHRPGALFHALEPLARNQVNLVQLVSRPLPKSPWRYRFDVVLDGHVFDETVRPALQELRAETRELRLFGSYAAEAER
ncbi:MAG TPA: prephenate dehydratase domain-containing protein [Gaiellaceae bacterium]|nr:prephenate dehydratase domain-containing protein [Gaiellaceae bacterium]